MGITRRLRQLVARERFGPILYPQFTWRRPVGTPTVYLTFDDGPHPEVTPAIFRILNTFGANATFFCVGQQAERHPDLVREAVQEGHSIGNHTFSHLDGSRVPTAEFLADVERGHRVLTDIMGTPPSLFRFPFGRSRPGSRDVLCERYEVVMWDIVTWDWDSSEVADRIVETTRRRARPGSIVVFHDSPKAKDRVLYALPRLLEALKEWRFEAL